MNKDFFDVLASARLDPLIEQLFGSIFRAESSALIVELNALTPTVSPVTLETLINTKLRPRLADYMMTHKMHYLAFFESEATFHEALDLVRRGQHFYGDLEKKALMTMMAVSLVMHEDAYLDTPGMQPHSEEKGVHLVFSNRKYHCLLNPKQLPETLRYQLFPMLLKAVPGVEHAELQPYRQAMLKKLLKSTFVDIPKKLDTFSKDMPRSSGAQDRYSALVDSQLKLRFDAVTGAYHARKDLDQVPQAEAYSLTALPKPGSKVEAHRLEPVFTI